MHFRTMIVVSAIAITAFGALAHKAPETTEETRVVVHDAYTILSQTYPTDETRQSY